MLVLVKSAVFYAGLVVAYLVVFYAPPAVFGASSEDSSPSSLSAPSPSPSFWMTPLMRDYSLVGWAVF